MLAHLKTMTWYLVSPPPMSSSWTLLNLVECVQLTAVEVNGLTSKQETLTPRRTQGGSSRGNAALQIRALRKEFLLRCLQASQHLPARLLPRLKLFIPATHCNALQNSGNFKDRKTGAEWSAVSDRSVKGGGLELGAWSLEVAYMSNICKVICKKHEGGVWQIWNFVCWPN